MSSQKSFNNHHWNLRSTNLNSRLCKSYISFTIALLSKSLLNHNSFILMSSMTSWTHPLSRTLVFFFPHCHCLPNSWYCTFLHVNIINHPHKSSTFLPSLHNCVTNACFPLPNMCSGNVINCHTGMLSYYFTVCYICMYCHLVSHFVCYNIARISFY